MGDYSFLLIKQEATGHTLAVQSRLVQEGFKVELQAQTIMLTEQQARELYCHHRDHLYYEPLVKRMSGSMVRVFAVDRPDAVKHLRALIGATDPKRADNGTFRALYGASVEYNGFHSPDNDLDVKREAEILQIKDLKYKLKLEFEIPREPFYVMKI